MFGITPGFIDYNTLNLLMAGIAFQEMSLSRLINAEGEKIQLAIGTLPGLTPPAASRLLPVKHTI